MPAQAITPFAPSPDAVRVRHDGFSIFLHWITLVLILVIFAAIKMRENVQDEASAALLLAVHRSAGVSLWLLTLLRLFWHARRGTTVALPPSVGIWQRRAATANHVLLYALLFLQPATGFLQSVARGKPFLLFGAAFPAIVARDRDMTRFFHQAHEIGANLFLALIALHALAAIGHGLRRDGVMGSMLPFARRMRA